MDRCIEVEYFDFNKGRGQIATPLFRKTQERLLDQLNIIDNLTLLKTPPSNHLEKLKGDLNGFWSLRINIQWRIIFKFEDGYVFDVDIVDYHY